MKNKKEVMFTERNTRNTNRVQVLYLVVVILVFGGGGKERVLEKRNTPPLFIYDCATLPRNLHFSFFFEVTYMFKI